MLTLALVTVLAGASPPPAPMPRPELILIDDRAKVPPEIVKKVAADVAARTGVSTVMLSDASKKLDAPSAKALAACAANACLADVGRKLGADVVLSLRVEKREGVLVLTASRIAALAKAKNIDDTELARNEGELGNAAADAVTKLFPVAAPSSTTPKGPTPPMTTPAPTTTTPTPPPK